MYSEYSPGTPRAIRVRLSRPRKYHQAAPDARESLGAYDASHSRLTKHTDDSSTEQPLSPTVFGDEEGVVFSDLVGHPASFMNEMNNDAPELDGPKDLEVYRRQVGQMQSSKISWTRRLKNENARMAPHRVSGRTIRAHNRLMQPMRIQH